MKYEPNSIKGILERRILERFPFDYFKNTNISSIYVGGNSLNRSSPNDIDLYPVSEKNDFYTNFPNVICKTPNSITIRNTPHNIQICNFFHPTLKALVDSFDFAHIQIGATVDIKLQCVEEIYYTEAYEKAHIIESTAYVHSEYPLSSLIRLVKYAKRDAFAGSSYIYSIITILKDIVKRGFDDYNDFKSQLDAVDLGLLPEDFNELDREVLLDLFEVLRKDKAK